MYINTDVVLFYLFIVQIGRGNLVGSWGGGLSFGPILNMAFSLRAFFLSPPSGQERRKENITEEKNRKQRERNIIRCSLFLFFYYFLHNEELSVNIFLKSKNMFGSDSFLIFFSFFLSLALFMDNWSLFFVSNPTLIKQKTFSRFLDLETFQTGNKCTI